MNDDPKSRYKSLFRLATAIPALGAFFCLLDGALALASDGPRSGEHAALAFIVGGICLVVTAIFIFVARDALAKIDKAQSSVPPSGRSQEWASRLSQELDAQTWDESCLNPENSGRAQRAIKGEPDIG